MVRPGPSTAARSSIAPRIAAAISTGWTSALNTRANGALTARSSVRSTRSKIPMTHPSGVSCAVSGGRGPVRSYLSDLRQGGSRRWPPRHRVTASRDVGDGRQDMRHGYVAGLAVAGLLALTGCSDDGSSGDPEPGGSAARPALTHDDTDELLLTEDEFPLEGYSRGEPVPVSTDVAVLAASALMDSEALEPGCREAAELARAALPRRPAARSPSPRRGRTARPTRSRSSCSARW